jgi:hypothetical protein
MRKMIGWINWRWVREKLFPQDTDPKCHKCKKTISVGTEFHLGREVKLKAPEGEFVPWHCFCAECKINITGKV